MSEKGEKKRIFDPVRRKWVVLTPEEEVRQFVIRFLREECAVPLGYISSEIPLRLYGKDFRCDLSVSNRKGEAVMLIECKRPTVALGDEVLEQAMRYNIKMQERFVVITNGMDFRCFERCGSGWRQWERFPAWSELNPEN